MTDASAPTNPSTNVLADCYYDLKGRPYLSLDDLDLPENIAEPIQTLTEIAEALGVDDLSFSTFSEAVERLEAEELFVARSLLHTHQAEDELTRHLLSVLHETKHLERWTQTLQSVSDSDESAPALERRKAALNAKAKDYQKQLDLAMSDMPEAPPVSITELAAFRKHLKKQEHELREKRAKVEAFQGLPPNIDLARHALAEARDKQMGLIQLRERLLGKMVDGVN
ncbi:hypothetical protein BD413DRAFT_607241 [Trametes elegans]|nr:hypothetical protein BD413DRAFT_607241 [Trametes elegans]